MAWLADLTSGLGLPGAGATLAVAAYGLSTAVEKLARKPALNDIARAVNDTSLANWLTTASWSTGFSMSHSASDTSPSSVSFDLAAPVWRLFYRRWLYFIS